MSRVRTLDPATELGGEGLLNLALGIEQGHAGGLVSIPTSET